MVPVYALLLFGGVMSVQHEQNCIQLDGWATFQAPAMIAALVRHQALSADKAWVLRNFKEQAIQGC